MMLPTIKFSQITYLNILWKTSRKLGYEIFEQNKTTSDVIFEATT